jgi:hypothetical protein
LIVNTEIAITILKLHRQGPIGDLGARCDDVQ